MSDRIMFVDDERSVLEGYHRLLYRQYDVVTASSGGEGLKLLRESGPFAVVVSDMRMPGMSGAEFLTRALAVAPDTIRMLLTGYADLNDAIRAVNEGQIFRYLTKPCDRETLQHAVHLGVERYHKLHPAVPEESLSPAAPPPPPRVCTWDNFESPTGLGGPTQAREHLASRIGVDRKCYVALLKSTSYHTVAERYGDDAACDFLNYMAQNIVQDLRGDDKLFHWGWDVLMAVLSRTLAIPLVRTEVDRLRATRKEQLLDVGGGHKIMLSCPIAFDVLPVLQFHSVDELVSAFNANVVASTADQD